MTMDEYIKRKEALAKMNYLFRTYAFSGILTKKMREKLRAIPAADVVEEENILKFYYVRSIDEYWIGQRIDNFYYAEYDPKIRQWVWTHSRYLPWGEHVVSPTSLWKEHTYPSEPEEIPFAEWLQGFIKKHIAVDGAKVRYGEWVKKNSNPLDGEYSCSACGSEYDFGDGDVTPIDDFDWFYCPNCGAKMEV